MRPQPLQRVFMRRCVRLGACVTVLALLAACASTPPPNDQMQRAQTELKQARQAGASDYDPVDLQFAAGKFRQAQAAMAKKHYGKAAMRAEEAEADAQLAFTKARLAVERQKIQTQTRENARLRKQLLNNDSASGNAPAGSASAAAPAAAGSTLTLPDQVLPQPAAPAPASSSAPGDNSQGGGA